MIQLKELYGVDPRYATNLIPTISYTPTPLEDHETLVILQLIQRTMQTIDERDGKKEEIKIENIERNPTPQPPVPFFPYTPREEMKSDNAGIDLKSGEQELSAEFLSLSTEVEVGESEEERKMISEEYSKEQLLGGRWYWLVPF